MSQQPQPKILLYHHVYATDHGIEIADSQWTRMAECGLSSDRLVTSRYSYQDDKPQLYEGKTLDSLWEDIRLRPWWVGLILYTHTKGASHPPESQPSQIAFRHALEEVVIDEWQSIIQYFVDHPECDCYGAYLTDDDRYFFPGNFWWARSSHIRSLPNPIEWAKQSRAESMKLHPSNIRYGYEDWVTLSKPGTIAAAKYRWRPDDKSGVKTLY